jgi:two-component system phosphate regulon sensor histidine kinase PhoR
LLILFAASVSMLGLILSMNSIRTNLKLSKMKSDFVAMVSHELKTPLAGISLVGETLSRGRYSSKQDITDYGTLLSEQTARLKSLVDNLLSSSRITDSNVYAMKSVDVHQLVTEALARLQPLIQERSFEVTCDLPNRLPSVRCDLEATIQAVKNLIENAIKYSDKRKQIEVRAFDSLGYMSLVIKDSGIGISSEDIPYIFDMFFRGQNANAEVPGSGLGLWIANKIIKDHHGQIHVDSVPDRGTVMTVTLPTILEGSE